MNCSFLPSRRSLVALGFWIPLLGTLLSAHIAGGYPGTAEVSLHLDPLRVRPFFGYIWDADVAAIGDRFYAAYVDDGGYARGIPVLASGPTAPNPLPFAGFTSWGHEGDIGVADLAGEALIAWSDSPGGVPRVRAAWQPTEVWTHRVRPLTELGPGRSPAVAGAGDRCLVAWVHAAIQVAVVTAADWPQAPTSVQIADGIPSQFSHVAAAYAPPTQRYIVAWKKAAQIELRIVDQNGAPVSAIITQVPATAPTAVSASWDGTQFVVVWSTTGGLVEAARVNVAGVVLERKTVAGPGALQARSASRPGETLIAWIVGDLFESTYVVRGARLDPTGNLLDPGGFVIHNGTRIPGATGYNFVAGVTSDATNYLVVWIHNYPSCGGLIVSLQDVYGAIVSPPTAAPAWTASGSAEQSNIAGAWLGDRLWTAWNTFDSNLSQVMGARRSAEGALLDPNGILAESAGVCPPVWQSQSSPSVAATDEVALTAWRRIETTDFYDLSHIEYRLHDPNGLAVAGNSVEYTNLPSQHDDRAPIVATNGNGFLLAFASRGTGNVPVVRWAGLSGAGGSAGDGVADLGSDEQVQDAAAIGSQYLLAWSIAGDGRDSFVGRIDASLTLLDPTGIPLATGPGDQGVVRITTDGANYFAVWPRAGSLLASRIALDGTVLDPAGIPVAQAAGPYDVDWDGTHYVVAWIVPGTPEDLIMVRRLDAVGNPVDPAPVELLRRPDDLLTCSVSGRDGISFIALATRRPVSGAWRETSGYGLLYQNPSVLAVSPSELPVPVAMTGVVAYPNPFRASSVLRIVTGARTKEARIWDPAGRLVRSLGDAPGTDSRFEWDGRDAGGRELPAGVYFFDLGPEAPARGKIIKLP